MPFAAALRKSLQDRDGEVPAEFERGDTLEDVLNRHLKIVEQMGGDDVFTCILLLSADGKRLSYGAAPTVPASYCRASESIEIGPRAGSCAAAAHLGGPVYSVDIATDPVWGDYRDLALAHGFRSCWSTPIRNSEGTIIGTFAILHRTMGMPTRQEIEAIDMITEHVADAIMWFRDSGEIAPAHQPALRLIAESENPDGPAPRLAALIERLQSNIADLERQDRSRSGADAQNTRKAAELSRKLIANIKLQIELLKSKGPA